MSESKHTPGPWIFEPTEVGGGPWPHYGLINGRDGGPVPIHIVLDPKLDVEDDYEAQANARLVAAAPELLEALQAIIQRENDFNRWGQGTLIGDSVADNARRAIAKATGQEQ